MTFCSVIICVDGRIQLPVIQFLQQRFNVKYVDVVSEIGPNQIIAEEKDDEILWNIHRLLKIPLEAHNAQGLAIVGHHDCLGNKANKKEQLVHLEKSVKNLKGKYQDIEVIGLWVNENFVVEEVA